MVASIVDVLMRARSLLSDVENERACCEHEELALWGPCATQGGERMTDEANRGGLRAKISTLRFVNAENWSCQADYAK